MGITQFTQFTGDDWNKAEGDSCQRCGQKVLRLMEGVCFPCNNALVAIEIETLEQANVVKETRRKWRQTIYQKADSILADSKKSGIFLDMVECYKCQREAVLVITQPPSKATKSKEGGNLKVMCPQCGTLTV